VNSQIFLRFSSSKQQKDKADSDNYIRLLTICSWGSTMLVVSLMELTEFGSFGIVKGQVKAQQNSSMCDLNYKSINATEPDICSVPKTIGSSSANTSTAVTEQQHQPLTIQQQRELCLA
jgi:hypothetical protein